MVEILVTLSPEDSLAKAAETLLSEHVTGAPVLEGNDRCVGVLSVIDLIRAEGTVMAEQEQIAESEFFNSGILWPATVYAQRLEQFRDQLVPVAEQPVSRFMTTDIVSVLEGASLATVVRRLIDAHVHRVLVLDEHKQLHGIISTMDVLAALQCASQ